MDLSSCRPVGFGPSRIPVTSVLDYARHWGMDHDMTDDLVYFIREMDNELLAYNEEENPKSSKVPIGSNRKAPTARRKKK